MLEARCSREAGAASGQAVPPRWLRRRSTEETGSSLRVLRSQPQKVSDGDAGRIHSSAATHQSPGIKTCGVENGSIGSTHWISTTIFEVDRVCPHSTDPQIIFKGANRPRRRDQVIKHRRATQRRVHRSSHQTLTIKRQKRN